MSVAIRLWEPKPPSRSRRSPAQRFANRAGPALLLGALIGTSTLINLMPDVRLLLIPQLALAAMFFVKVLSMGRTGLVAIAEANEKGDDHEVLRLVAKELEGGDACDANLGLVRNLQAQAPFRLGRYRECKAEVLEFHRSLAWEASEDAVCALAARGMLQLGEPELALAMMNEIAPAGFAFGSPHLIGSRIASRPLMVPPAPRGPLR